MFENITFLFMKFPNKGFYINILVNFIYATMLQYGMINVYITCKDKAEAAKIANALLNKKLIACANYFPIKSVYAWKGKIVNDNEYAVLAKSVKAKFDDIVAAVKQIHSYECPCIEMFETKASKEYEKWANSVVKKTKIQKVYK